MEKETKDTNEIKETKEPEKKGQESDKVPKKTFVNSLREYIIKYRYQLFVVSVIAIPCIIAYVTHEITLVKSVLLIIFASLTVFSFLTLVRLLEKIPLGIQRSAPSIDGSISGWRFTNSLTHLLITCVFAVATLMLYIEKPRSMSLGTSSPSAQKDSAAARTQKAVDSLKAEPKDTVQKAADTSDSTK